MIQMMKMLAGLLLAGFLAACGGGGGSPGTTTTGGGSNNGGGSTPPPDPKVTLTLVTSAGSATSVVSTTATTYARAVVTDSAGAPVAGTVVSFAGTGGLVKFVPSSATALTDSSGVAQVEVQPATATAAGAGTLTADATVAGKSATQGKVSFQVPISTPDTPSARVNDFALFLDRTTLPNSGTATVKLSVVAVDTSNNVVPGAAVTVSTDKNSVFVPGGTTTDSTGTYAGQIGIGADKSDRTITATVTINNKTKTTSFNVTGTKIVLQVTPSSPAPGTAAALTATVTDAAANPIRGVAVTLGGNVPDLQGQVLTTDATGSVTKAFIAPGTAGVYTISASGYGVSASDYQLQVFSSQVPIALIPAGALPSLSASPNVLAVNSPGSTSNRSTLRFLFLDSLNRPVSNVRVRFVDTTTGLPAVGASLTSAGATLYTDASGTVSTQYIAGQNSSPTNGVSIKACYKATDFTDPLDCPASASVSLTVAGQALAVSIGDDNLLEKGTGTYIKRFVVTVADSAGRAVPGAAVDISVDLTHYGKGLFIDDFLTTVPASLTASFPSATTTLPGFRSWCANEDTNRNGNVDPGENINASVDSNGQPTLEPRKSDLLISYNDPTVTTTNASGILIIKVEYSQRFATWLSYRVRATANVAGSQGMAERDFITDFVAGDEKNGSFLIAPYGTQSCSSPN